MYECEIGQGLLGNSVARAVGGAVQNATLPFAVHAGVSTQLLSFHVQHICLIQLSLPMCLYV